MAWRRARLPSYGRPSWQSLEDWDPFLDATRLQAVTDAWGPSSLFRSEDDRDACAKKWRSLIEQAAGPRTRSALREWRPGANAATDAAACVLVNGLRSNARTRSSRP